MSKSFARVAATAGLIVGLSVLPGCGGSEEPVTMEAPSAPVNIDHEAAQKEAESAMQNYDPRKGSPAETGGGGGSPANL